MTHPTNQRLAALMEEHGLTAQDVARLMNRSDRTVYSWLQARNPRKIPEHSLELLEIKLGERKLQKTP